MRNTRIVLADDHVLVRQGLRSLLEMEDDMVIVGEAGNGQEVIEQIQQGLRPHIVLMDIQMPVMTGIEATRQLKRMVPHIQIIALTASDEDITITEMLDAGASGYVLKSAAASDLVKTIRANQSAGSADALPDRVDTPSGGIGPSTHTGKRGAHQRLTRREADVMKALLRGQSNKEIARELVISERTVQTHLSNIFSKMNVNSRTEAVLVAIRDDWIPYQSRP
jgi:two-component system, NarL family, response regulator LiaR